ncbi:mitochondrial 2-oxoglutarate/malate carrier protein [Calliopsis andreniformis]|uniref:mitochondrial 2-oxoglutarate/malate carrier protein n=1 Tax=Calliopsis andreniformis TaxID=337506 RepID=UPI003FCC9CA6
MIIEPFSLIKFQNYCDPDSGIGQTVTHPLDVIKVRMQIAKTPLVGTVRDTWRTAGLRGFYAGWSAGFLRQLTYSTTRLGIYTSSVDFCQEYFGRINYATMIGLGLFSGMVGAFVGTPTELMLVRMTADLKLPPDQRWNYKNPISGLYSIYKTEGLFALWKGAVPTMIRAGIANGTQLGTYTKAKIVLIDTGVFEDGLILQFSAGMVSGLVMCAVSIPADVAKSRIQNQKSKSNSKPPGLLKVMLNIAKDEGIFALWRGFIPYYTRSGPHAMITMVCVDQFQRLYLELLKPLPSE